MWPRWTVTPVGGTSAILMVLFSLAPMASARSTADLLAVDVESGHELHVVDVVLAELHVHQTRDRGLRIGVPVVLDALDQRCGTVTYTDDCNTNRI